MVMALRYRPKKQDRTRQPLWEVNMRFSAAAFAGLLSTMSALAPGADWMQFRGPRGLGVSDEKGVPVKWGTGENIAWQVDLPVPGSSSPIVVRDRVYVTCYTGYGVEPAAGNPDDLRRHLLCFDGRTGEQLWSKTFAPILPDHQYQ